MGLLENCRRFALQPGTGEHTQAAQRWFQLYGDGAYACSTVLISPFLGPGKQTQPEKDFNAAMAAVLIEVEHGFAVVLSCWPGLRCF
jgi:hypothetical protein